MTACNLIEKALFFRVGEKVLDAGWCPLHKRGLRAFKIEQSEMVTTAAIFRY